LARKRLPVDFSEAAEQDLYAIRDHIAQDRPKTAARWLLEAKRRVDLLRTVPFAFEAIRNWNTSAWIAAKSYTGSTASFMWFKRGA
jgi:plasmid stabilization system protein ParE